MKIVSLFILFFIIIPVAYTQKNNREDLVIAKGQMPDVIKDKNNHIHIVYGSGDSIMNISSRDGYSFTSPSLIAVLPRLFASAMRGPQIAATSNGPVVTACNNNGNIFSYKKEISGKWTKAIKINDVSKMAKEALMGLSGDGLNVYAVWLGVKSHKGQNVYGARSIDGGKTWAKNILVYASPDGTVCECCKPSVVVKENKVYVMFRNWLNGNRDLYLSTSSDGGKSFGQAQKLGNGNWKLNSCPMDGGGLAINKSGTPETVWRREKKIYTATPRMPEKEIGEGRSCSIETISNKNIYAWTENGNVIVVNSQGIKTDLGKGNLPLVKALNKERAICVWENENKIHRSVFEL